MTVEALWFNSSLVSAVATRPLPTLASPKDTGLDHMRLKAPSWQPSSQWEVTTAAIVSKI